MIYNTKDKMAIVPSFVFHDLYSRFVRKTIISADDIFILSFFFFLLYL